MRNDTTLASPLLRHLLSTLPIAFLLYLSQTGLLHAETDGRWLLCGPPAITTSAGERTFDPSSPLELSADQALFDKQGISLLSGHVEIQQGNRKLTANRALYDYGQRTVRASGAVRYRDGSVEITGESARIELQANTGSFDSVEYRLPEHHAHGTASRLEKIDQTTLQLQQVNYTTCNPGHIDWQLRADKIRLDRSRMMGVARDVSVRFKNVPFFYFPYLVFPIADKRLSGFLMPDISVNLSKNSADVAIPYYWNIAPNLDATITPRVIDRRGLMLGAEFRYLTATSSGQIEGKYLEDDRMYGDTRALLRLRHRSRFNPYWSGTVEYNYVSDEDYFIDMGDSFNPNTTTHQERRLTLSYRDSDWSFSGTALSYQILQGTPPPYQKLPQLKLQYVGSQKENSINYHLTTEFTYFDDNARNPTGSRFDISPGVSYPMHTLATYIIPRLTLHHTRYLLDNRPAGMASAPTRTLPAISVDSGVFLERLAHWGNSAMLQTLEPRLFYLYIPYRRQNQLPLFDTAAYTFDYAQLFRENRFTNADRINDANQLSIGLTSRLLQNNNGAERLKASIGQIIYFSDRRVSLDDTGETAGQSDLAAELKASFSNHWSIGSSLLWDPQSERNRRFSSRLQYKRDARHLFTIDYRHQYDPVNGSYRYKRFDISGTWAINPRWHLLAHWDYDLDSEHTRETLFGFGYDSCCWGIRLVSREFRKESEAELDRAIFVNLELKGLSNINGKRIDALLKDGILGYEVNR